MGGWKFNALDQRYAMNWIFEEIIIITFHSNFSSLFRENFKNTI